MKRETEVTQEQVNQELLKIFTDEKLHEVKEDELLDIVLFIIRRLKQKKKKIKEEEALIYI